MLRIIKSYLRRKINKNVKKNTWAMLRLFLSYKLLKIDPPVQAGLTSNMKLRLETAVY